MKSEVSVWLVTTDHLEDSLWFRDDEDFKVGMNYVAVQAAVSKTTVLVFILMSNHVHFILVGSREDALSFINGYKMRYSKHLRSKYGIKEFLRRNGVDLQEIPLEDEALERAIAYVQMNCVAANICSHPSQYPWGCGSVFFNPSPQKGIELRDLSARARRLKLHCAIPLPEEWKLGEDGVVIPASYLNIKYVETLFRTPKRMNYFLQNSSKARKRTFDAELPAFRDQTIISALPDLCRSLFGKPSFPELSPSEKAEMLRQLRFRFSCNANQLARVTAMSYAEAAKMLDSY